MSWMPAVPRAALVALALLLVSCGQAAAPKPASSPAGSKVEGNWGGPVSAPDDEHTVRALLRAAAQADPAGARASCARFVVAMPALWHGLASSDPMLDRVGLQRVADVETPKGRRRVPILIFAGQDALLRLLGSPAFAALSRHLAGGYIRPASELERKLIYALVGGFERGEKITIAQSGSLRVAFLLDHGHVFWMELLSAWQPSEWAWRAAGNRVALARRSRMP